MKRFTLIVVLILLASMSVSADEFSETKTLAEQGNANAQYNLGVMYGKGDGVPQDYAEAVKWYRKAAEQGDVDAQFNLGIMYGKGEEGVPQDYAEAAKWYRKVAEQGEGDAQFNLAFMYFNGDGVPQDYAEAYVWYSLAAASGQEQARNNRDLIAKELSPADLCAAQKRSAKLFKEIQQRKQ